MKTKKNSSASNSMFFQFPFPDSFHYIYILDIYYNTNGGSTFTRLFIFACLPALLQYGVFFFKFCFISYYFSGEMREKRLRSLISPIPMLPRPWWCANPHKNRCRFALPLYFVAKSNTGIFDFSPRGKRSCVWFEKYFFIYTYLYFVFLYKRFVVVIL